LHALPGFGVLRLAALGHKMHSGTPDSPGFMPGLAVELFGFCYSFSESNLSLLEACILDLVTNFGMSQEQLIHARFELAQPE
jgi:hypothetical protein